MERLRLCVLGQLSSVDSTGNAVLVRGSSIKLVLSALALNAGRVVTTDALAEAIWGRDRLPSDPASTLRTYIARVRQVGDGFTIQREGAGYRLVLDPGLIDATVFEQRATAGLAMWRAGEPERCTTELGAALAVWGGEPWLAIDDWHPARGDAARLLELHQLVEEHEAASRLAQGHTNLVADLRALVTDEPLREFRWELLMRALATTGQQAEALRCYQEARTLFVEEVGLEPSESMRGLDAAIACQQIPPLVPDPQVPAAPAPVRSDRGHPPGLVDRSSETSAVRSVIERIGSTPAVLTITGEAGIGKSRVAEEAGAIAAERGLRVVTGRCYAAEASGAYRSMLAPVRQLIEVGGVDTKELRNLQILLPELADEPDLDHMGEDRQVRLFDSVSRLVSAAADPSGLAIIIDDLQWIDEPSADLLSHLMRHNTDTPLLLAVTYRETEVDEVHPVSAWLTDVARHAEITPLAVTELATDDADELLTQTWPGHDSAATAELFEVTGGNPLFLLEFGRLMADSDGVAEAFSELPPTVTTLLDQRLASLSDHQADIVSRLAVSPGGLPLEQILGALPLDRGTVVDALESLMSRGLIIEQLDDSAITYDFSHGLYRLALQDKLSLARQVALHHELALAGEPLLEGDPDFSTARVAYHWYMAGRSGDPERAEVLNRRAGELALRGTAYQDAATHFGRAIKARRWQGGSPDSELHLRAAESCSRAGLFESRRHHSEEAFALAEREGRVDIAAHAALIHGGTRSVYGSPNIQTTQMLRMALETLEHNEPGGSESDTDLRAMVMARCAQELNHNGELDRARELSAEAVRLAGDTPNDRVAASVFREQIWTLNHPTFLDERLDSIDHMLDKATQARDPELELEARVWNAAAMLETGEADRFEQEIACLKELGTLAPVPALLVRISTLEATLAMTRGHYQDGMQLATDNYELGLSVEPENAEQVLRAQMIAPLRDMAMLGPVAEQVGEIAEQYVDVAGWQCAAAFVFSELGSTSEANRIVDSIAADGVRTIRRDLAWAQAMTYLATTVANLGRVELVDELYEEIVPFAGRHASLWDIATNGAFDHYLGILAMTSGDHERAVDHLEAAAAMNKAAANVPAWLWSRLALHEAQATSGVPATEPRSAIMDAAGPLGLVAIVQRCEALQN